MRRFRYKNKNRRVFIIGLLIFLETLYIIIFVGNKITPKLIQVIKNNLQIYTNNIIRDYVDVNVLADENLNEIIDFVKSDNGNIIGVDYNMYKAYNLLGKISQNIKNNVNKYIKYDSYASFTNNGLILRYPIGLASNNIFLNNLGFKVPIKVILDRSVLCGLITKVSNYGLNNVVISIYLNVNIYSNIISSQVEVIHNKYEILLDSSIVMGQVPSYLNGRIESSSPIIND